MLESLRNKRILIVVAHPDDEILGLGATMHRLIAEFNVTTHVVILGEGITSRDEQRNVEKRKSELRAHKAQIALAQKAVGYHRVSTFDFPDNRFDSVPLLDIVKIVEKEKTAFSPQIIFTHHGGDLNIDHQRTFDAVMTATRPMADEGVEAVMTFETASGTEWRAATDPRHFLPNVFIEVGEKDLKAKVEGMECYEFERRSFPHPRSPEALRIQAQRCGVANGFLLAEAFCLVRFRSRL